MHAPASASAGLVSALFSGPVGGLTSALFSGLTSALFSGLVAGLLLAGPAAAQQPVTLEDAVAAALAGPREAMARADSAAARAQLRSARAFPNPSLTAEYSVAVPTHHLILDQPLEYPWVRAARIRAALAGVSAADYLLQAERSALRYDVALAYAGAAAARAVQGVSASNLSDALELVRVARARRAAGDASELDVALASVTAGQARNAFLTDSLAGITSLLDLQALMGMATDSVRIVLADSLDAAPGPEPGLPAEPLRLAAARLQLRQQQATVSTTRWGRIPAPGITGGIEQGDDSQPGILPLFGLSLEIPLWNRGGGALAEARAAASRARAALALAEQETRAALVRTGQERAVARERADSDRAVVADARRVAELALTAYHEGAYPLASVLEAQRNARDARRQFIQDLYQRRAAEAGWLLAREAGGPVAASASGSTP